VVVVTFPVGRADEERLRAGLSEDADVRFLATLSDDERGPALHEAEALLLWNWRREIRPEDLPAMNGIRFIQLVSAGADHLPFVELPPRAVVAGNVGAYAEPMAEHVLAMVLALAKRLPQNHAKMARGEFDQFTLNAALRGATAGILGFGGIGKATARLFRAFGTKILAVNTSGLTDEDVEFVGTLDRLDDVLAGSDVVVIALPLTRRTRGLIGARELELMKPEAILVNVARGAIVDQEAVYRHLGGHPGFSAGIDAWWTEPFGAGEFRTDFPFFDLPNLLGSPHNSAVIPGAIQDAAMHAVANLVRYLRGEDLIGVMRAEDYD
jgi:glycerate dehydrogenase